MLQNKYLPDDVEVNKREFSITCLKKQKLFAQCWCSNNKSKALLILFHSLGEHSSRYDKWALGFAGLDFAVLSYDMRSHGKSYDGSFRQASYNLLLSDINLIIEEGQKLFPNIPVFLYGHGMGGNLLINYAISNIQTFSGLILSSPWLEFSEIPSRFRVHALKILSRFVPKTKVKSIIKVENLSRELREVHNYKSDPLIHSKVSARLFVYAIEKGVLAKKSLYKINVPVLILHGTSDKIASVGASRDFVMNSGNITSFVEYEGAYHDLHFDSDKEKVFQNIVDWLNRQIIK